MSESLDTALEKSHRWLLRVERADCPYCIKSNATWQEVTRACPTRTRVVPRAELPNAVTSVRTVPRYLIARTDGKIVHSFGDSNSTSADIVNAAEAALSAPA